MHRATTFLERERERPSHAHKIDSHVPTIHLILMIKRVRHGVVRGFGVGIFPTQTQPDIIPLLIGPTHKITYCYGPPCNYIIP